MLSDRERRRGGEEVGGCDRRREMVHVCARARACVDGCRGVGVSGQLPKVQCETFGVSHLRPHYFANLSVREGALSFLVPSICVDTRGRTGNITHR